MKITKYLLYFFLLLLTLGELGRFSLDGSGANIHLFDLVLPVLIFSYVIFSLGVAKKFYLPPLTLPLVGFTLVALISLIIASAYFSPNQILVSSLYLIRFVLYASLYFITYAILKSDPKAGIIRVLITTAVTIAIAGFIQFILVPDFSQYAESDGWDPHQQRVLSTFFDPNLLGTFLVMVLGLLLTTLIYRRGLWSVSYLFSTILIFVAFILTFSRGAYIAFLVVVTTIGIFKSKILLLVSLMAMVIAVATVPRISERIEGAINLDESASARVVSWKNSFEVIQDHPLIGVGFNTYRYVQDEYGFFKGVDPSKIHSGAGVDSSLLLVTATTGVVGLVLFLYIFIKEAYLGYKNFKKGRMIGLISLATLASLAISSQFVNALFFPQIMAWYFIIFAINDYNYTEGKHDR